MRQLFRVGEMAKLFGMNLRTLRYYDQIGLLTPSYTDPTTKYRYYATEQFERLNTIRYLRAQGVSLADIAAQLGRRDPKRVLELLRRQQELVAQQMHALRLVQGRLKTRVEQMEDATRVDKLDAPRLEQLPCRPIAVLRRQLRTGDDLELPLRHLENSTALGPNLFLGKVGLTLAQEDLAAGEFEQYSSLFCLLETGERHRGGDALSAGEWACLRFRGTHAHAAGRYQQLMDWLTMHGRAPTGDGVEFALVDDGLTDDPAQFVTEIQIPVA